MSLPAFEQPGPNESLTNVLLRYILDALSGGSGGSGGIGFYNKPEIYKKSNSAQIVINANTVHSIYVVTEGTGGTLSLGGSAAITLYQGTPHILTATTLIDTTVTIVAPPTSHVNVIVMQP